MFDLNVLRIKCPINKIINSGLVIKCLVYKMVSFTSYVMYHIKSDIKGFVRVTWFMDDSRTLLPPIRAGWRYKDGKLLFCRTWEQEDRGKSGDKITKDVLLGTMQGVENYLAFTAEVGEEFDGWLPTLDTNMMVDRNKKVLYKHFEKEPCSKKTIQRMSAMGENSKQQILSQDLIRRLMNTSELLSKEYKEEVIDKYAEKIQNSGFSKEQTIRIIINPRGYEGKRRRRSAKGLPLRSTAKKSRMMRYKKKLLSNSTWFKKRGSKE